MTENKIQDEVKEVRVEEKQIGDVAPLADNFTRTEKFIPLHDACCLVYPRKFTNMVIESSATFNYICTTHPPPKKLTLLCGSSFPF